jgi:phage shock protein E
MSKRKQQKQQSRRNLYFTSAIAVVVVVFLMIFASRGRTSAAQNLSPIDYQTQFIASNTSHLLLDVRTPEEFASGHIDGAVNIPVESLQRRLSEVPMNQPIVVYCRSGNRSAQASQILAQAGYTRIYDMGGLNDWVALGFPVE